MTNMIEIKNIDPRIRTALIIRHGDRELIPVGEIGNEIPINETGKKNAINFGRSIQNIPINHIFSSPIPRCVQTANCIVQGNNNGISITETKSLGDPGLHIDDEIVAGKFYLEHGFDEMYRKFCTNEYIPGVPSPMEFKNRMDLFIEKNTKNEGITIFITHDSIIAFYDYCLTGKIHTKENWIPYLTGIIKSFSD